MRTPDDDLHSRHLATMANLAPPKHDTGCPFPRHWLSRFQHRLWVCWCGQAWRTEWVGTGGGAYLWLRWPE